MSEQAPFVAGERVVVRDPVDGQTHRGAVTGPERDGKVTVLLYEGNRRVRFSTQFVTRESDR